MNLNKLVGFQKVERVLFVLDSGEVVIVVVLHLIVLHAVLGGHVALERVWVAQPQLALQTNEHLAGVSNINQEAMHRSQQTRSDSHVIR